MRKKNEYKERVKCQLCKQRVFEFDEHLNKEHKTTREKYNKKFSQIECPVCGRMFQSLRRHISGAHKMTIAQFREEYPNAPTLTAKVAAESGASGSKAWTGKRRKAQAKRVQKNCGTKKVRKKANASIRALYQSDEGREIARKRLQDRWDNDDGTMRDKAVECFREIGSDPDVTKKAAEGLSRWWAAHPEEKRCRAPFRGFLFSKKAGREIGFRSGYERAAILRIDDFDSFEHVEYETLRISYFFEGKFRTYIPDFLVKTLDGDLIVIEIKPPGYLKVEMNLAKIEAAKKYCASLGWTFEVWSLAELRPYL